MSATKVEQKNRCEYVGANLMKTRLKFGAEHYKTRLKFGAEHSKTRLKFGASKCKLA